MPILSSIAFNSAKSFGFTASSAAEPPPTVIGQAYGGGYYAGQISTAGNGIADFYLVVAPKSSGQNSYVWSTTAFFDATPSVINGPGNTNTLNNSNYPGAQFCKGLSIGGYSDWYWPAVNEIEVCYYNLKPTTSDNITFQATNINAVPTRNTNYTLTVPGQTSAANFVASTGAERFDTATYWSSTTAGIANSYGKFFQIYGGGAGGQFQITKTVSYRVRAVRRVAV